MPPSPLGMRNAYLIRFAPSPQYRSCFTDRLLWPGVDRTWGPLPWTGETGFPIRGSVFPTPPFPEYISGHSTFSAAGAEILRRWTRSDHFGESFTIAPGSSV